MTVGSPYELALDVALFVFVGMGYGAFCRRVFYWRGALAFVHYSRFGLQMFGPLITFFILRAYIDHNVFLTIDERIHAYRDIVLYTLGGMIGYFLADRAVELNRALPIRASFRVTGEDNDEMVVIEPKPVRRKPRVED